MIQVEKPQKSTAFPDDEGESKRTYFLAIIPNGGISRSVELFVGKAIRYIETQQIIIFSLMNAFCTWTELMKEDKIYGSVPDFS